MVLVSYSGREINSKIVYYGPGLSGKTTNLESIFSSVPDAHKGRMVSVKTKTERTLFFDFLPVNLGELAGFRTRFLLYTVPGQVYYNATRKLVLKGVDAVVFVADSQRSKLEENRESLQNLRDNLRDQGMSLEDIPWVIQYNKRDLPGVMPVEELERHLNPTGVPSFAAVATQGTGVLETFKAISRLLLQHLSQEIGVQVVPAPAPAGMPAEGRADRMAPEVPPVAGPRDAAAGRVPGRAHDSVPSVSQMAKPHGERAEGIPGDDVRRPEPAGSSHGHEPARASSGVARPEAGEQHPPEPKAASSAPNGLRSYLRRIFSRPDREEESPAVREDAPRGGEGIPGVRDGATAAWQERTGPAGEGREPAGAREIPEGGLQPHRDTIRLEAEQEEIREPARTDAEPGPGEPETQWIERSGEFRTQEIEKPEASPDSRAVPDPSRQPEHAWPWPLPHEVPPPRGPAIPEPEARDEAEIVVPVVIPRSTAGSCIVLKLKIHFAGEERDGDGGVQLDEEEGVS